MKTIVVGVDHSGTAAAAARIAAELADRLGAELIVVTAYPRLVVERVQAGADEIVVNSEEEALEVAHRVMVELRADEARLGVPMSARAAEGKPGRTLVRLAEELGAELIVVGNKRVQGPGRVLGSVAAEVARTATCDVYIAHTHTL